MSGDELRHVLAGDVEPLRRFGVMFPRDEYRKGCRRPRLLCRLTRHRFGKLQHQRWVLARIRGDA